MIPIKKLTENSGRKVNQPSMKRLPLIALMFALILLFTACGNGDASTPPASNTVEAAATNTPASTEQPEDPAPVSTEEKPIAAPPANVDPKDLGQIIGRTEDEIISLIGAPVEKEMVGNGEITYYYEKTGNGEFDGFLITSDGRPILDEGFRNVLTFKDGRAYLAMIWPGSDFSVLGVKCDTDMEESLQKLMDQGFVTQDIDDTMFDNAVVIRLMGDLNGGTAVISLTMAEKDKVSIINLEYLGPAPEDAIAAPAPANTETVGENDLAVFMGGDSSKVIEAFGQPARTDSGGLYYDSDGIENTLLFMINENNAVIGIALNSGHAGSWTLAGCGMANSEAEIKATMQGLGAREETIYNKAYDEDLPFYYFNYNGEEYCLVTDVSEGELYNLSLYSASALQ
mgnify:CR=1 FL=1